jgi:hypothetical protein
MKKLFAAFASIALFLGTSAVAAGTPDNIVKAQLDSKGIKYKIDKDGDFEIVYKTVGSRTQVAWVRSTVNTYGSLKIREIWSPGYKSDSNDFPVSIANKLLNKNYLATLGAWEAQGDMAVFVVKIPADASADQLVDAVESAVDSADEVEKELTGDKDEY